MLRNTAIRLTLLFTCLFGALAIGVVIYISNSTGKLVLQQVEDAVDEEVRELAEIYQRGGEGRMIRSIERRAQRPDANLYRVLDREGRALAGNVASVGGDVVNGRGWMRSPFPYTRVGENAALEPAQGLRAIGRVFDLRNGGMLLVGRDVGDHEAFRRIVARAASVSLAAMVLSGLLIAMFVGRQATRRLSRVTTTTRAIVAGDLSRRLPVDGSGDEFDGLAAELNNVLGRIERLNSGVRAMSDAIAHDLKTPLARLRNRADQALRAGSGEIEALEGIVEDAKGLIGTFDALLMISQTEAGARAVSMQPLDLCEIATTAHELFEPSADEADVALTMTLPDRAEISGNRELLMQVAVNLLDNALKYGRAGGQVTLRVSPRDRTTFAFSVADDGPGIPEADRQRVLDRFVRLDESRNAPGSGLGLALVDAIVKLHGGTLELTDNAPGLVVTVLLPTAAKD